MLTLLRNGGLFRSVAYATSADGSVVVGSSRLAMRWWEAFIWDEASGMRNLREVLVNDHGLAEDLTGWTLSRATGLSADGLAIIGFGNNRKGRTEAWVAVIPEPATLLLLGAGLLSLVGYAKKKKIG